MTDKIRTMLAQRVKGLPLWAWGLTLVAIFCAALLFDPAPQPIPAQPGLSLGSGALDSTRMAIGVFTKLTLAAGLIYLSWILLRRWKGGLNLENRQLVLMETLHLSSRQALHLVRAGKQVLLIGGTDNTLNLIGAVEIAQNEITATKVASQRAFATTPIEDEITVTKVASQGAFATTPSPEASVSFLELISQRIANH